MVLFKDLSSGLPYCEACWEKWSASSNKPRPPAFTAPGSGAENNPRPKIQLKFATPVQQPKIETPSHSPAAPAGAAVLLSDVPIDYDESSLKELHNAAGIDSDKLLEIKFLLTNEAQGTRTCMVKYSENECAQLAVEALHGVPVLTQNGEEKMLGARIANTQR
eukprot:102915-Amphidinium_carterae.1